MIKKEFVRKEDAPFLQIFKFLVQSSSVATIHNVGDFRGFFHQFLSNEYNSSWTSPYIHNNCLPTRSIQTIDPYKLSSNSDDTEHDY